MDGGGVLLEKYLMVMIGGAIGSLGRYLAGGAILHRFGDRLPAGTLFVNVTGSFLAGLLMTVLTRFDFHSNWRLLLVVGFLGGYTTFSSYEWEIFQTGNTHSQGLAWMYAAGSVLAGFAAVWCGAWLGRR
jgi:CrcB protein